MKRGPSPDIRSALGERMRRLDRFAADLNIVLIMFAIGLATLDLTFLVTQRVVERLPELVRVNYVEQSASAGDAAAQKALP